MAGLRGLSSVFFVGAIFAAFVLVALASRASAQSIDDVSKRLAEVDARIAELNKENAALHEERSKLAGENVKLRDRLSHVDDRRQGSTLRKEASAAEPASPVRSWSGLYIGANAGGAWGRDGVMGTEVAPVPPFSALDVAALSAAASPNLNISGFSGGVQVGWNYQIGHTVWGIENDFGAFHLRGSTAETIPFPATPGSFASPTTSISTNWMYSARARVGWADDHWLAYVTGGLAVTRENFSQIIGAITPFVFNAPITSTQAGWIAGGGIEYALSESLSARVEYLYADFGSISGIGILTPSVGGFSYTNSSHLTASLVRVGVNYRLRGLQ